MIVGRNAQGKTNLLEAISILSAMGSHRTSSTSNVVRRGSDSAVIRGVVAIGERSLSVDAEIKSTGGLRLLVNKVPFDRSNAGEALAVVVFSPEDLSLTKGGPEERRRFLDQASARVRPLAAADKQEFDRVLKQRNGMLKASQINPRALRTLDVWDEQFVKASSSLVLNRLNLLRLVSVAARRRYVEVAGAGDPPEFNYEPTWCEPDDLLFDDALHEEISLGSIREKLSEAIAAAHTRDLDRGITTTGPHRDDLAIEISGADARYFASQGEQRSLALALRLAERDLIIEVRNKQPVLLLDDVFSELDDSRRAQLAELVASGGQTIATATSVVGLPMQAGRTIRVEQGKAWADD
jgi:DNA replication and repair protein RecF